MVNLRTISKIIGQLLFLESGFMIVCVAVSFYYHEEDLFAFLISLLITIGGGFFFKFLGYGASANMSRRDAYFIVTATWVIFSAFGMLPYIIGGYITNVNDAFFESMSGFTTTGATVLTSVEWLPHGILFWRSLTQWVGALGIVFFTIAILPSMVGGSVRIFAAEATGPIHSKMHPRLSTNAKWIWSVYLTLTFACACGFKVAGMGLFDAVNYSMTTTATGGFSIHDASIAAFHSPAIEYVAVVFMFLAGVNFTLLYIAFFKGNFSQVFKNTELKMYLSCIGVFTLVIMVILLWQQLSALSLNTIEGAFRSSLFHVVSFLTTTGIFAGLEHGTPIADSLYMGTTHLIWLILGGCMFLGACSGSTSGGFKCIRGVMMLEVLRNELRRILHPNAVLPVKLDGVAIGSSKIVSLLGFFTIYVLLLVIGATIMVAIGIDNINAIAISFGCITNTGPSLATEIGPPMSWDDLPAVIKWLCSLLMLMGRIEIMSVLLLFTPSYWKDN